MNTHEAAVAKKPKSFKRLADPQFWRLVSGLVLFAFAITHFLNHALGLVSLDWMEQVQLVRRGFWRSPPGTVLLYGAFAVHVTLVLVKFVNRRSLRLKRWEAVQLLLGLSIPILIVAHVVGTRGLWATTGFNDVYSNELRILWPEHAFSQSLLLAIVWLHAMIGLHHWLSTKRWYARYAPFLLVLACLIPTLALTGWIEAARRIAEMSYPTPPIGEDMLQEGQRLLVLAKNVIWSVFALVLAAFLVRRILAWLKTGPAITYVGGREVRAAAGSTLLEISQAASIAHASVCGGRGRCTTCRVMVVKGLEDLPPPNATEASALARIAAPPGVRLACQIRPEHPLTVRPLIPLKEAQPTAGQDAYRWGVERRIAVMFADLRGFTTLAEKLYPFDSVFLLNRYFEVMTDAIEKHGGTVDKFLGDGVMALFGLTPAVGGGSRDAIFAARDMLVALERLNLEFAATLSEPLRMGIGIHLGPVVLGRVGGRRHAGLTALGDTVNIASRLESLNKEFASVVVLSEAVLTASRLSLPETTVKEVPVRGREGVLRVVVASDLNQVAEAAKEETWTSARS